MEDKVQVLLNAQPEPHGLREAAAIRGALSNNPLDDNAALAQAKHMLGDHHPWNN